MMERRREKCCDRIKNDARKQNYGAILILYLVVLIKISIGVLYKFCNYLKLYEHAWSQNYI